MTTKPKTRKAPAAGTSVNPKLATLAAECDEIEATLRNGGLGDDGEDDAAIDRLVKLEDRLAKVPATSMEDMKLKARYVDLNCVKAHNIGPVPASIIRDLLALGGERGARGEWRTAQALVRHKAAQAAIDAHSGRIDDEALAHQLFTAESDALDVLANAPCVTDAEFVEKLRYLLAHEARIAQGSPDGYQEFGSILIAVDRHFNPINA